jgi:N-acetyl-alpha-D-glucosaminyl L-malate synthase BshA
MKIGFICYPTYGGSGVIGAELGQFLARRGHEVHFICYNIPARLIPYAQNIIFHPVEVVAYPLFQFPPYTIALASKTAEVIKNYGLNLIHAHYAIPHSTSAHLAQQIVGDNSLKIITTLHGTDIRLVGMDPSYYSVTKYSIENNNGITAVSNYLARVTKEEFKIDKHIEVIPNFVDTERFKRKTSSETRVVYAEPNEKIVTHVSNFRSPKRVTDVVRIFKKISQKVPAWLLMVGEGPDMGVAMELVNTLGLTSRVRFLHMIDPVEDILSISDLFLLPSGTESFGLAALEAMSCEVPVVATDVEGIPELVEHGGCGFLAPVKDVDKMAEYAIKILYDEVFQNRLGERGREIALEKFNEEAIVSRYEQYYEKVLDQ